MRKICTALFLLLTANLFSQTGVFSKRYSSPANNLKANCIVPAFDKGLVFAGQADFNSVVVKTDSFGNVVWSKVYSASGSPAIKVICRTSDSCYAVAGKLGLDMFCMKLKKNGDTTWAKNVVATTSVGVGNIESIQQTRDKGFVISSSEQQRAVVTKLDSVGNLQWQRQIVSGNYQNWGTTIKQLSDSSYVALLFSSTQTSVTLHNTTLIKLSKTGNFVWEKSYNKAMPISNWGLDMEIVEDGIVTLITVNSSNGHALLKTDFLGNVVWCKAYNVFSNSQNQHRSLTQTKDKGFVFGTTTTVFRTDSVGIPLWINDFTGPQPHIPLEIVETKNKTFASVTSYYNFLDESHVVTMDSLGNTAACTQTVPLAVYFEGWFATAVTPTIISGGSTTTLQINISTITVVPNSGCPPPVPSGINEQIGSDIALRIAPNPSNGIFTITTNEICSYIVTDGIGKLIAHGDCNKEVSIDISKEASGIYFLHIKDETGKTLGSRKLIKK